jgi:WD40 repeat protein
MMHPDKFKAQLLTMSTEPSALKVYSTATYRAISTCSGSTTAGLGAHCPGGSIWDADGKDLRPVFARAGLSADGRMVACGCPASGSSSILRMWDAQTGTVVPSPLSDILLPYPVRSIAWHPKQHVVAVAMVCR